MQVLYVHILLQRPNHVCFKKKKKTNNTWFDATHIREIISLPIISHLDYLQHK
jgi:hypothetical protein